MKVRSVIMLVGATVISLLLYLALVAPGTTALSLSRPALETETGMIAFVSEDKSSALEGWTRMQGIDPLNTGDVSMWVSIKSADPLEGQLRTVSAKVTRDGAPTSNGSSIVMTGRIAEALKDCGESSMLISRDVAFQSLSPMQQSAAINYFENPTASGSEATQADEPDGAVSTQQAADSANLRTYTVVQPADTWHGTVEIGDDSAKYQGTIAQYTCTFENEGFWQREAEFVTFRQPAMLAVSAGDGEGSWTNLLRTSWFVQPPFVQFSTSSIAPQDTSAGLWFNASAKSDNTSHPVLALRGYEAQFVDEAAATTRKNDIFWSGVGIGLIAGLGLAMAKTLVILGMTFLSFIRAKIRNLRVRLREG